MTAQADELKRFLLGVQSNLEDALNAVSQKLNELHDECAYGAHDVFTQKPHQVKERGVLEESPEVAFLQTESSFKITSSGPFPLPGGMVDSAHGQEHLPLPGHNASSDLPLVDEATTIAPPKLVMSSIVPTNHVQGLLLPPVHSNSSNTQPICDTPTIGRVKKKRLQAPDYLLTYTADEHRSNSLSSILETLRIEKEVSLEAWQRQILLKDAFGQELTKEAPIDDESFPVTVQWQWISRSDFSESCPVDVVRFYWLGLRNNHQLKAYYLCLHAKLRVLAQESQSMTDGWMSDKEWRHDQIRKRETSNRNWTSSRRVDEMDHDTEIALAKDALRRFEALLLFPLFSGKNMSIMSMRADKLLLLAGCALEPFLDDYFAIRDNALNLDGSTAVKHRELVKAVAKAAFGLECLFEDLHARITNNDQLLFRIYLMLVNLLTFLAQLFYELNIRAEPLWKQQIRSILQSVGSIHQAVVKRL